MLKDWLILRSRLSVGTGIDTYGTTRVFVEMLIGTLLEILLDMTRRCYYDCIKIGRYRMLCGTTMAAHYVGVDTGEREKVTKPLTRARLSDNLAVVLTHPTKRLGGVKALPVAMCPGGIKSALRRPITVDKVSRLIREGRGS
jgi:hypothetical protein